MPSVRKQVEQTDELLRQIHALNEQVKLLIRAERRLSMSRRRLDRQVQNVESLNHFVLEAGSSRNLLKVLSLAIGLLFDVFPFEQGVGFVRNDQERFVPEVIQALEGSYGDLAITSAHREICDARILKPMSAKAKPVIGTRKYILSMYPEMTCLISHFEEIFTRGDRSDVAEGALFLVIPIACPRTAEGFIGLLVLRNRRPEDAFLHPLPSSDDQPYLKLVGAHIATIVQNIVLYQSAVSSERDARRTAAERKAQAEENARLYQQARAAVHVRDEFLSVASHELRTPITPIKSGVQLIRRLISNGQYSEHDRERLDKLLQIMNKELTHLTKLVNGMLDVTQMTSGRLEITPEPVDLNSLIREIVERYETEVVDNGTVILLDLHEVGAGVWDRVRIEQVVTNLVTNAVKYGNRKPIKISTESRDDRAWLCVEDQGIGISEQDRDRVFERFERGVSQRHSSGLGLGLFIVRQIVEAHGGKIWFESELGKGTKFTVELPLMKEKLHAKAA